MCSHLPEQLEEGWLACYGLSWDGLSLFSAGLSFSSRPTGASWEIDRFPKKKKKGKSSLNTQIWHTTASIPFFSGTQITKASWDPSGGERSHLMLEELQSHVAKGRDTGKSKARAHFGHLPESASPTCTLQPSGSYQAKLRFTLVSRKKNKTKNSYPLLTSGIRNRNFSPKLKLKN